MKIECPTCKKNINYYSSKFRPFCSDNCKQQDLRNWANSKYSIPVNDINEYEEVEYDLEDKIQLSSLNNNEN